MDSPRRTCLDVCCYVGGFALTIARHRPDSQVLGIDTSAAAIDRARRHAQSNDLRNVRFEVGDFFETLDRQYAQGERYEAMVLDPPKLAGSRDSVDRALRAYHRLNYAAVRLLKPGESSLPAVAPDGSGGTRSKTCCEESPNNRAGRSRSWNNADPLLITPSRSLARNRLPEMLYLPPRRLTKSVKK